MVLSHIRLSMLAVICCALTLAACQTTPNQYGSNTNTMGTGTTTAAPVVNKQNIGTVAGAIGGAFAGSNLGSGSGKTLGTAAGAIIGGFVGNQIGQSLDRADQLYHQQTSQRALETARSGEVISWNNPDNGNSGTITPTKTYKLESGKYCREFTQTISVGGESQQAFGTACRQPDGSWKLQS